MGKLKSTLNRARVNSKKDVYGAYAMLTLNLSMIPASFFVPFVIIPAIPGGIGAYIMLQMAKDGHRKNDVVTHLGQDFETTQKQATAYYEAEYAIKALEESYNNETDPKRRKKLLSKANNLISFQNDILASENVVKLDDNAVKQLPTPRFQPKK